MKKFIVLIMLLAICASVNAAVNLNEVNDSNVRAGDFPQSLRRWIGTLNDDIVRAGVELGTGQIFYVDSNARDGGTGNSVIGAVQTLDAGIDLCEDSRGDIIYVVQGHAESLAAADAVDADVIGITIIGLGNGSLKPTFTYSAPAGEFVIGADNVALTNLKFNVSSDAVTLAIDIEDAVDYALIDNCEFVVATSTDEAVNFIKLTNNNTGCVIQDCTMDSQVGTPESAIMLDADTNQTVIRNNLIQGDYSIACIEGDTALSTEVLITGNLLVNGSSDSIVAQPAIDLLTGTTGYIVDNYLVCNVATVAVSMETCDAVMLFNNFYNEDVGAAASGSPWHVGTFGGSLINSVSASGDG